MENTAAIDREMRGHAAEVEKAYARGRAEAFAEAAAEAMRMFEANAHQCGACGLYEPCVQAAREDGADAALETLAAWCEGRAKEGGDRS